VTSESDWLWWTLAAAGAAAAILFIWIWLKGRAFAPGDVFRASRISSGNHLFPTQVLITPTAVVQYTPRWFGKREETIHMAHIASVKIETGMILSDVFIETSGGTDPIACHGHRKGDAGRMKDLIERYQTNYYRGGSPTPVGGPDTGR
jgi:hypothetical protein